MVVGVKSMSFAMDDLNMSFGVDNALQAKIAEETRLVEKSTEVKPSDSPKKEPEVNDVFEASQQKPAPAKNSFEGIQEESTAIDIVKESLDKITSYVTDIKSNIEAGNEENVSRKKIDENYEKISKIAKETSFNDKKLIEISEDKAKKMVSLEEMKINDIKNLEINTVKQKEESVEKLNDIINNIKNKEQDLKNKQEELIQRVNEYSLVEIKRSSEPEIKEEVSAEELKETAINDIKENPVKSRHMQIKHIDRNLLLAMLSLRAAS